MGENIKTKPICRSVFKSKDIKQSLTHKWVELINQAEKNKCAPSINIGGEV